MNPSVSSVPSVVKPVQRSFDLELRTGRPTLSVNAAMSILDRNEDDILNLIELGYLPCAVDIRSPSSTKKEIRIFADSIRSYMRGDHLNGVAADVSRRKPDPFDQALATLFKHSRPTVRGVEISRALNCSSQHTLDLLREGCFSGEFLAWHPQPEKLRLSPIVDRKTVIAFLKSRRLT